MKPHPVRIIRFLACLTAVLMVPATVAAPVAAEESITAPALPEAAAETVPGRIVITWDPDASASDRIDVRTGHGLRTEESFEAISLEVVSVPAHTVPSVAAALAGEPAVALAEADFVTELATNDPGYGELWGLHNTGQEGGVADVDIDAPEAWALTRGRPEVIVAVVDTGIDITHPDLAANIWRNPGEIPGNGIDDDDNGYVDDVNGWDFYSNDKTVYDSPTEDFHGTHVAGTIAALGDNGMGVVGVAPRVTIMPIKTLGGPDSEGSGSAAAAGIAYAHANGATVINTSWGGGGGQTLKNVVAAATGAVVVAAAGNLGNNMDLVQPEYPAAWAADAHGMPNVLSVAAVERTGVLPSWSNYGQTTVDIGAPGRAIASTAPGAGYAYASGTSMAAPHASGVAALLKSLDGTLSGAQLGSAVKAGAEPLASLVDKTTTGRLLNAHAALARLVPSTTTTTTTTTTAPTTTTTTAPTTTTTTNPPATSAPTGEPLPYDGTGARSLEWACPGITQSGFSDVPSTSAHAAGVGCAAAWEVFIGSGATFGPSLDLTRGQLASVLVRAIEQAIGSSLPLGQNLFTDDDSSVHRVAIDKLAALGIVAGVTTTTYAPGVSVTRGQFATMLARTYRHLAGTLPIGQDAFADDDSNLHEAAINALAALGVIGGTSDGLYQPNADLSRAQSATLVSRLLDALVEAQAIDRRFG